MNTIGERIREMRWLHVMTRDELARMMAEIKQARDERIEIWIQVVEADGTLAERIYRGSFQRPNINNSGGST